MNENLNNNVNNNLNNQQGMNNNVNNEPKKNNNIIIIAVIILAVILLIVIKWKPSDKNDTPYVPKDNTKQVEKSEEKTPEEKEEELEEEFDEQDKAFGYSLLPNKDEYMRFKIANVLSLLADSFTDGYKEISTNKEIVNTTFTMTELRNKKKLYSEDINDYIKLLWSESYYELNDAWDTVGDTGSFDENTQKILIKYGCESGVKLKYCDDQHLFVDIVELNINSIENVKKNAEETYKTGIFDINKINNIYREMNVCKDKNIIVKTEDKIIDISDTRCGSSYSYPEYFEKILDVKESGKSLKVYLKVLKPYVDESEYIYGISKLMDNNIIKISPTINLFDDTYNGNITEIADLFTKYGDKLETLVLAFEKNNNGHYVFDYVELVS